MRELMSGLERNKRMHCVENVWPMGRVKKIALNCGRSR